MSTVSYKTLLNGVKYWAERTFLRKDDEGIEAVKADVESVKEFQNNIHEITKSEYEKLDDKTGWYFVYEDEV